MSSTGILRRCSRGILISAETNRPIIPFPHRHLLRIRPMKANTIIRAVVTDDTLAAMGAMANYYRWLTGAKEFTNEFVQDESLRYQALDRNYEFAH